MALGWQIEYKEDTFSSGFAQNNAASGGGGQVDTNPYNYNPTPADMSNLTLSKEMMSLAERLSEDAHDIQVHTSSQAFLIDHFTSR